MIKIIKREDLKTKDAFVVRVIAILLALLFTSIFIAFLGYPPLKVLSEMFFGSIGSRMRLEETLNKTAPLLMTSLGILVAFKLKFWNIGAEGQIMMGALSASYVALNYAEYFSSFSLLSLMFLAAVLGGGVWAAIPAIFKIKMDTNETIFTLMLNYIAIKIVQYLQFGPWKDPQATGFPKIPTFQESAILPKIFGVPFSWILALILTILVALFLKYTKKGYEISVVGESMNTAKYAGMNVNVIILFAIFLSGALSGVVGMIQASSMEKTLNYTLSSGYGFTAIITTWLSGLKAPYIILTSLAFAMLVQGGNFVQISMQIPAAVSSMIQGVILFFVLGSEFFIRYKVSRRLEQ